MESSVNELTARQFASTGSIDIRNFVRTEYGRYVISRLANRTGLESIADITDIREAVEAIDSFLGKKRVI